MKCIVCQTEIVLNENGECSYCAESRKQSAEYFENCPSSLAAENYFSKENNLKYMGASQFKAFKSCEAGALAELNGEYPREITSSLLVGSYVDAHVEGTLDIFRAKNPQIFTRQGDLKSEYRRAEKMIERFERDEIFMRCLSGEKQVIKTGEIGGVPFKIKMDVYFPGIMIVDLKTVKDFEPLYREGEGRLNFMLYWGYDIQAAIYQAVEGDSLPFYIAAVTKEPSPDIRVIEIPQEYIDLALDDVEQNAVRYEGIKMGLIEPDRCEKCNYCKATRVLTGAISMEEFDYE